MTVDAVCTTPGAVCVIVMGTAGVVTVTVTGATLAVIVTGAAAGAVTVTGATV